MLLCKMTVITQYEVVGLGGSIQHYDMVVEFKCSPIVKGTVNHLNDTVEGSTCLISKTLLI